MKFNFYLKDKLIFILIALFSLVVVTSLLLIFDINKVLILLITIILLLTYLLVIIYDYVKRKLFYDELRKNLNSLDKKYLITEMIKESNFIDSKLLTEFLYEIDKSMHEEINNYKYSINEFIEYIELWCHEIKTPIATTKLIIDNNKNEVTKSILEEVEKIENYIEQVLYYSRSDLVEKDYIIGSANLKKIVDDVIKKNKKDLINKKIKVDIDNLPIVESDSKWLTFIINQIITNSIKYSSNNPIIKIYAKVNKNNVLLNIEDNGIGIIDTEISKVFDKGFTGTNGRIKYNSTGIGLYLCKKLCDKLGHSITICSKINNKTIVTIVIPNNSMINLT